MYWLCYFELVLTTINPSPTRVTSLINGCLDISTNSKEANYGRKIIVQQSIQYQIKKRK